jgi:hypothetical protein
LRIGSALSVPRYALFAWIMSAAVTRATGVGDHVHPSPPAMCVLTNYVGVGILLNLASRRRSDRLVMAPVAAVLCACCLVLAPA